MSNADVSSPGAQKQVPSTEDRVLWYYLAAEYRRAVLWGIGGCIIILLVGLFLAWQLQKQVDPARIVPFSLIFAAIPAWCLQYLWPRIRVDRNGISRRILWWWDLWPWEAFADGRIRFGKSANTLCYVFRAYATLRRTLSLELLEETDAKVLNAVIRRVWNPPPPEPIPESIQFQFCWPDCHSLEMTPQRLTICSNGRMAEHRWKEVVKVEIWRTEHGRHDFRELRIQLSDEQLHFREGNYRGISAEAIAGFLCRHVDPSRLRDFSLQGLPSTAEEIDARQVRDETRYNVNIRSMRWLSRLMWCIIPALPLLVPWPKGLLMAALYSLLMLAVHWLYLENVKAADKHRREHEAHRVALMQQGS